MSSVGERSTRLRHTAVNARSDTVRAMATESLKSQEESHSPRSHKTSKLSNNQWQPSHSACPIADRLPEAYESSGRPKEKGLFAEGEEEGEEEEAHRRRETWSAARARRS